MSKSSIIAMMYIITFAMAFCISYTLTPLIRWTSLKMHWLDKPNWRKVNTNPMPLVGGLAIFCGFLATILFISGQQPFFPIKDKLLSVLATSFIICLVGMADDIKGLSPRRKLFYQLVAAAIATLLGFMILKVSSPFGGHINAPFVFSLLITVLWIIGFTNAINLMDGLDGLAAGVSSIIAISLFFAAIRTNNPLMAILSIALAGSALGFLPHNFFPAKIFMGDTGSMFLGFIIALISIEGAFKSTTLLTLIIPIVAMGVPIIDTGLSILRRLVKGNGVFKADKEHIHHRLLFQEGSQKKAVIRLYLLTGSFGLISVSLSGMKGLWVLSALIITLILTLRWIHNTNLLDFEATATKEKRS